MAQALLLFVVLLQFTSEVDMDPKYLGGKKRNNGYFGYINSCGMFRVGSNHVPMTNNERERFFKSNFLQHGRKTK